MAKGTSQRRTSRTSRAPAGRKRTQTAQEPEAGRPFPDAEHVRSVALRPEANASGSAPAGGGRETPSANGERQATSPASGAGKRAQPRPAATPPATAQAGAGPSSRPGHVLAGVVGGLIVLALLMAFQWLVPTAAEQDGGEEQQITALSQEISALEQAISRIEEESRQAASAGTSALAERVAALEKAGPGSSEDLVARIEQLRADMEATRDAQSRLIERVDSLEQKIADRSAEQRINRAFAAARLKSAIDRGGSFAPELRAYEAVAPDDPAIATLRDLAESGVPTRQALVERFAEVARDMLNALHIGNADSGMLDRLMASARSVVTVRPTGDVEGSEPEAIVARMENALNRGDLGRAIAEWESLPQAAKEVSLDYAADIRARLEAERILTETLSAATEAVSQETN